MQRQGDSVESQGGHQGLAATERVGERRTVALA
jgi:hypothetical protein